MVFDHPYGIGASENVPHRRSFSAALAVAARRGLERADHEVDVIDLHADGFDPVMHAADLAAWRNKTVIDPQVAAYQARVLAADHLVFVFPIWWELMPALTKGFIDKVITKGVMYDQPRPNRAFVGTMPRLRGVSVVTVMSTPMALYRAWFGAPLPKAIFRGTFRKLGVKRLRWLGHAGVAGKSPRARARVLARTEERFAALR
jgi:putative NADPH-quinone reductase